MKPNLTSSIEQFREKYGTRALTMEEDFEYYINNDFERLKNDREANQHGYVVMYNEDLFREFSDYLNAIGMYNGMFVLIYERRQYYAYSEYVEIGKRNILKALADEAERYKQKAGKIESLLQEYGY